MAPHDAGEWRATERSSLLDSSRVVYDNNTDEENRSKTGNEPVLEAEADNTNLAEVKEPATLMLATIMCSIWVGNFLAAVDSTMVATLSAPISSSFDSFSLLSWLASAYFIANAALQPLAGKLTDIWGRRSGLIFSNVFFCLGNLICGLAEEQWVIIFGRVVAGAGGGGLTAIATIVQSDFIPLRRRGIWQGIGNITFGLGAACGGVFGGFVSETIGWRWAFLIQVPATIISGTVIFFTVKVPDNDEVGVSKIQRVDFMGASSLIAFLVLLLLGLNSGGNTMPWAHPLVLISISLSLVLLGVFLHVEANVATEPVIPVRILGLRTVLASYFANWFHAMAAFSILFYGPIYFQLRGASPTEAGVRIMPQSLGFMVGGIGSGAVMRWIGRYSALNLSIQSILVASFASFFFYDLNSPRWPEYLTFLASGIGYAGMLTVSLIALIASVDHKWQAVATSGSYAFRSTGSIIGITISSAVFQNILQGALNDRIGEKQGAEDIIRKVRDSLDAVADLSPDWKEPVCDAYMDALHGVFGAIFAMTVVGSLASLLMREHKLYSDLSRRISQ